MVLTLYGNPQSTCTKRVATVLKETNTPFKLVEIDLAKGAHKAPEFVAKQPFGQIPYLVSRRDCWLGLHSMLTLS
jgi:glutathione S-transferase